MGWICGLVRRLESRVWPVGLMLIYRPLLQYLMNGCHSAWFIPQSTQSRLKFHDQAATTSLPPCLAGPFAIMLPSTRSSWLKYSDDAYKFLNTYRHLIDFHANDYYTGALWYACVEPHVTCSRVASCSQRCCEGSLALQGAHRSNMAPIPRASD